MSLESLLLAHCQASRARGQRAVFGLNGPVGAGKTTLGHQLQQCFVSAGLRLAVASIDDAYLPLEPRIRAMAGNPFGVLRVPPGSHDPQALLEPIQSWRQAESPWLQLPRFDKTLQAGQGDRTTPWCGEADALLLEGWMLGCSPLATPALEPLLQNPGGLLHGFNAEQRRWLERCNAALAAYTPLWSQLDLRIVLWPVSWHWPRRWRFQAEARQRRRGGAWLSPQALDAVVQSSLMSLPPELYQRPLMQQAAWVRLLDGRRRVIWEGGGGANLPEALQTQAPQASSPSSSATG